MDEKQGDVPAIELPICPFCQGPVYYHTWVTHRIFQMECKHCQSHWRTGIKNNEHRELFVELISSKNPTISSEFFEKQLPLKYWQDLMKDTNEQD